MVEFVLFYGLCRGLYILVAELYWHWGWGWKYIYKENQNWCITIIRHILRHTFQSMYSKLKFWDYNEKNSTFYLTKKEIKNIKGALDKYYIYLCISNSIENIKLNHYWNFQLILHMCFHFMRYFVKSIIFRVSHRVLYCVFIEDDFEK